MEWSILFSQNARSNRGRLVAAITLREGSSATIATVGELETAEVDAA